MESRVNLLHVLKIALGCLLAMAAAERLGLKYSASAGVIALLSIHDTRRQTVRMVEKRLAAFLVALATAPVSFALLGYRPIAIGAFLLLFTPVCISLGIQEGISVSTVLMTHFLTERSVSPGMIGNEALLLAVGTGVGLAMNLYIPGNGKWIRNRQREIKEKFREVLLGMGREMAGERMEAGGTGVGVPGGVGVGVPGGAPVSISWERGLAELERMLEEGERAAYRDMENRLLSDTAYYLRYMGMRKSQLAVPASIGTMIGRVGEFPHQARWLAGLMGSISRSFHEHNNALGLLEELAGIRGQLRRSALPASREEFEARAVLFLILLELERFLELKRDFVGQMSEEEIWRFWEGEGR